MLSTFGNLLLVLSRPAAITGMLYNLDRSLQTNIIAQLNMYTTGWLTVSVCTHLVVVQKSRP